jgi:hypothetical protein
MAGEGELTVGDCGLCRGRKRVEGEERKIIGEKWWKRK